MPAKVEDLVDQKDATSQWFITPTDVSGDHLDYEREMILLKAHQFTEYGVHGNSVVMRVPGGRVLMTRDGDIIWINFCPRDRRVHLRFWMNRSSVKDIGKALKIAPEKRGSFEEIFLRW